MKKPVWLRPHWFFDARPRLEAICLRACPGSMGENDLCLSRLDSAVFPFPVSPTALRGMDHYPQGVLPPQAAPVGRAAAPSPEVGCSGSAFKPSPLGKGDRWPMGQWWMRKKSGRFRQMTARTEAWKRLLVVLERRERKISPMIVQNFARISPISCCFFSGNLLDYISASSVKEDRPAHGPRSAIPWRRKQRRYSPTRSNSL